MAGLELIGEAATTSVGFFWKAGWAFVLGYSISAMIEAFVPNGKLTRFMGGPDVKSVGLATAIGAVSSSCSFAALAAARALFRKGAHFAASVAFMFASTNLVIELGVLIVIFLGWRYLVAEIIGGLVLIAVSTLLIRLTYPARWVERARERLAREGEEEDFDWRARIRSRDGWRRVGRRFFVEWGMVWQEVVIGFTVAGLMATFVPASFWKTIFLAEHAGEPGLVGVLVALENAIVAPFVAAATFIGSMGNIPLATVLSSGGVMFVGIMGFIYSDLMVPPLVRVNAKYYGWPIALYVAGVMLVSIVATALALHFGFAALGLTPRSERAVEEIVRFRVDYTFWLNLAALALVGLMLWLSRAVRGEERPTGGGERSAPGVQGWIAIGCLLLIGTGLVASWAGA